MANIYEPSAEEITEWNEWVESRPDKVRGILHKIKPWELYRMKSTGQRVIFYSVIENGTITVIVSGKYNLTLHDSRVFGIRPNDLEPCELPVDEPVGSLLSQEEVEDNIDALRVIVRPDLFEMNENGEAVRKCKH